METAALIALFQLGKVVVEKINAVSAAARQSGEMTEEAEAALAAYEATRMAMPHWQPGDEEL